MAQAEKWIADLKDEVALIFGTPPPPPPPIDPPIGGGDDAGMERIAALGARFDATLPTLATKADVTQGLSELRIEMHKGFADLQKSLSDQLKWIVGTMLILGAAGVTIMTFVLNNAAPKTPPQVSGSPVIITVPSGTIMGAAAAAPSAPASRP